MIFIGSPFRASTIATMAAAQNIEATSSCGGFDAHAEATVLREAMQTILRDLKQGDGEGTGLSASFLVGLLADSPAGLHVGADGDGNNYDSDAPLYEQMRGLPRRPFYHEVCKRLSAIQGCNNRRCDAATDAFLPATHFGVTELQSMSLLVPDPPMDMTSVEECVKWLQNAKEGNIMALLGLRRTVGTVSECFPTASDHAGYDDTKEGYLFPPSPSQLFESSRRVNKPGTKANLTVAARALAKHAHRGAEGFFGSISGGDAQKNNHAEQVVSKLIKEAAWINIHAFGGVDDARPVVEVRVEEGYGARWSAVWTTDAFTPTDIQFRGFLKPNSEDGHESRWRH